MPRFVYERLKGGGARDHVGSVSGAADEAGLWADEDDLPCASCASDYDDDDEKMVALFSAFFEMVLSARWLKVVVVPSLARSRRSVARRRFGQRCAVELLQYIRFLGLVLQPLRHPQQVVTVGAWTARVDVALAPSIELLWQAGVPTVSSCAGEGDGDQAYLSFPDRGSSLASFATLLHAELGQDVETLTVDALHGSVSVLRWESWETPALEAALAGITWPPGLPVSTAEATVRDFYDWR